MPRVNRISGITQHAEAPAAVSVPATSNQNPLLVARVRSDIGVHLSNSETETGNILEWPACLWCFRYPQAGV
jgi:hypothetical protein